MEPVKHLSIADIRNYMLQNDGKVTNHALVKHFKKYLTHTQNEAEARKRFKAYVTLLSTIKNENNQKFLILRKKYFNECPSEEVVQRAVEAADNTLEPGSSVASPVISTPDVGVSPLRHPPPYKAPPEVNQSPLPAKPIAANVGVNQVQLESYRDCVNEFTAVMQRIDPARLEIQPASKAAVDLRSEETNTSTSVKSVSRANSVDESNNKENIPRFSFSSGASSDSSTAEKLSGTETDVADNPISVKEATRKFNRMASEEEAKVISPPAKKKAEKQLIEEKDSPEVTLAHPKAKEWIVSMAKANYQELAKLASEYPELVKLQDPATGFTALHWAAKHGNEDVVKLIAGTYKVDVNARTNGGYTPLHLATQFGRDNIFELLWNVYKANRDIMDWSGNKPLDYSRQRPSVSASTCSKIKARKKHTIEKDLGFLRIGSLNVRVKKTTEAFSNFLGVGNGNGPTPMVYGHGERLEATRPHQQTHRHPHQRRHHHANGTTRGLHLNQRASGTIPYGTNNNTIVGSRSSVPISRNTYDAVHKSWGSADNITQHLENLMPPPKSAEYRQYKSTKRSSFASNATDSPRDSICSSNSSFNLNTGYSSMPTTPNQIRTPKTMGLSSIPVDSDSDSACGFDSNWSVHD